MDAADFNTSELFETGDRRAKRVAIEGISVQCLGVQHELAALGLCHWRDDRDLAAKLVSGAGLAPADALDLWRMQRIDFRPALALLLVAHPNREREEWAEAFFQCRIASDLAANIADDAAKPRAQELERAPCALE
jgi:hypothetical protein